MLNIPHPYEERMVEDWISSYRPAFEARERVTFAVVLSGDGTLLGSVTLGLNARDGNGQLDDLGLGERFCDRAAFVDDAPQGPDHASCIAALPDVAAEDHACGAGFGGVVDDL